MTQNHDDNSLHELESTLRKAFAKEKKQGLAADQLRALHEAIDRERTAPSRPPRWWQWSLAGTLLASAAVALIVVERFPNSDHATYVSESANDLREEKADVAMTEAAPPAEARMNKPATPAPIAEQKPAAPRKANRVDQLEDSGAMRGRSPQGKSMYLGGSSGAGPSASSSAVSDSFGAAEPPTAMKPKLAGPKKKELAKEAAAPGQSKAVVSVGSVRLQSATKGKQAKNSASVENLRATATANLHGIRSCYEALLMRTPVARGAMNVSWTIREANVKVAGSGIDASMRACVQQQVLKWKFPEGTRGDASITFRLGAD